MASKRQNASIFNDIVGPAIVGPSSSHTCGPSRIGFLCRQLLPGKLKKCVIEFAKDGAYANIYQGQRSDLGFVNGILGRMPENPRLCNAFADAAKAGIEITFLISDVPPIVPNISRLTLENTKGQQVVINADSIGGGNIRLLSIDGFDVVLTGDCFELIVYVDGNKEENAAIEKIIVGMFEDNEGHSFSTVQEKGLVNVKRRIDFTIEELAKVREIPGITEVKVIKPILTVTSHLHGRVPFRSAEEMLAVAKDTEKELWELGVAYETMRSGWTKEKVIDYMQRAVETMEHSVKEALSGNIAIEGIIKPTAGKVENYIHNDGRALDMGVLNTAVPWAIAAMESVSGKGVVICAPTGGSAGVFPGAVIGVANHLGLSLRKKIKAMFATAVIGIVMAKDCNFSAELYGCQVEPGAASAMAAGGLVYLMGGTAVQSCMAASCAIQNILGTICDPVAGLVQIPCINRNALAVANAVVSANMIMGGFDPLIPLDQAAETLFRVGKQLPTELKCTCLGGLCITPCGQKLARKEHAKP